MGLYQISLIFKTILISYFFTDTSFLLSEDRKLVQIKISFFTFLHGSLFPGFMISFPNKNYIQSYVTECGKMKPYCKENMLGRIPTYIPRQKYNLNIKLYVCSLY